jgi:hypothetical protein
VVWIAWLIGMIWFGLITFQPLWLIPTLVFVLVDVKRAWIVPHRSWKDVALAASILPGELFATLRAGWFIAGWWSALMSRFTGRSKDRWEAQYAAEAA